MSFPDGNFFIGLAKKQNLTEAFVVKVRVDDQYRFLLVNTRKVEEIVILSETHRAVSIGRHDVVGVKNRYRVGLKFVDQAFAVENEEVLSDGCVFHAGMEFYILGCDKQARRHMKIWLNIVFLLLFQVAEGQNKYWLYLTDKGPECASGAISCTDLPLYSPWLSTLESMPLELHVQSRWLNAVSVSTDLDPATLAALPFVAGVAPVGRLERKGDPSPDADVLSLALRQMQIDSLLVMGLDGSGVKIGVIDVGFTEADEAYSLIPVIEGGQVKAYKDYISPGSQPWDSHGTEYDDHGTDVWRLIAGYDKETRVREGLATGADFYLARTDHGVRENRAEEDYWVQALEWLDSMDVRLVHSSLGYALGFDDPMENHTPAQMDGKTTAIARAAQIATEQKGMLLIISAGNEGQVDNWRIISTPADAPGVISVGATQYEAFCRMSYSSIGPEFTDFIKPDISVFSFRGTSLAAPLITGLAALIWQQHPELSNTQLADLLRRAGHLYPYGNNYVGYGVPSGLRLLRLLEERAGDPASLLSTQERTLTLTGFPRDERPLVLFHKKDEKNVISQEIVFTERGQLSITRVKGARRCTVAHPEKVIEVIWED